MSIILEHVNGRDIMPGDLLLDLNAQTFTVADTPGFCYPNKFLLVIGEISNNVKDYYYRKGMNMRCLLVVAGDAMKTLYVLRGNCIERARVIEQ